VIVGDRVGAIAVSRGDDAGNQSRTTPLVVPTAPTSPIR